MSWLDFNDEDAIELARRSEQHRRHRIMHGTHRQLVEERRLLMLGPTRAKIAGPVCLSSNFLSSWARQAATLYDSPMFAANEADPVGASAAELLERLRVAGHQSIMPRFQALTLALNDYPMAMRWAVPGGRPTNQGNIMMRPVAPHCVTAESHPDNPGQPIRYTEHVRQLVGGKRLNTARTWDISDLDRPFYVVTVDNGSGKQGQDITAQVHGDELARLGIPNFVGDNYQDRYTGVGGSIRGLPFIPVEMYHAQAPQHLWSPALNLEAVEGTLDLAVMWSSFQHAVNHSSFALNFLVDGILHGFGITADLNGSPFEHHSADPSALMAVSSPDDARPAQLVQLGSTVDLAKLGEAIASREARLATVLGIDGGDLIRQSGDPRSGYALAIGQASKAELRRRFAPLFRSSDEEMLSKAAAIINRNVPGLNLPEAGWMVEYTVEAPTLVDPMPTEQPAPANTEVVPEEVVPESQEIEPPPEG